MKAAILNILTGSTGQKPVSGDVLMALGEKDAVTDAIGNLLDGRPPAINTARVMRDGVWSDMYWLTGGVEKFNLHAFRVTPSKPIATVTSPQKVQKKTLIQKGEIMEKPSTEKKPQKKRLRSSSEMSLKLLQKVIDHPGVSRVDLMAYAAMEYPEADTRRIAKSIWDMVNTSKTIRQQGPLAERVYFPIDQSKTAKPLSAAVKKSEVRPAVKPAVVRPEIKQAEAAPEIKQAVKQSAAASWELLEKSVRPAQQHGGSAEFHVMLSDENHLHLSIGDDVVMLKPAQTACLHRFLNRVSLGGV